MLECLAKVLFGLIAQRMTVDWRQRKAWKEVTSLSMADTWIVPGLLLKVVVGPAQAVPEEEHFPSLFLLLEHWKPVLHFQW